MSEAKETPRGAVKRSISLPMDLDETLQEIRDKTGDDYSTVIKQLIRAGLAASQENEKNDKESKVYSLISPFSDWLEAIAARLNASPSYLLRRIVVEGLVRLVEEGNTYHADLLRIQEFISRNDNTDDNV